MATKVAFQKVARAARSTGFDNVVPNAKTAVRWYLGQSGDLRSDIQPADRVNFPESTVAVYHLDVFVNKNNRLVYNTAEVESMKKQMVTDGIIKPQQAVMVKNGKGGKFWLDGQKKKA